MSEIRVFYYYNNNNNINMIQKTKNFRAWNGQYNDKYAKFDGYQKLAYALVCSTIETLTQKPKHKVYTIKKAGITRHYFTSYNRFSLDYADAYHFLHSDLFEFLCSACYVDAEAMHARVAGYIDTALVEYGDQLYAKRAKETKTICLSGTEHTLEIIKS